MVKHLAQVSRFNLSNAEFWQKEKSSTKNWQNINRIWYLQMRKCQRLVEWNLLGHPTVTSGKRQEVSSLGRSHSSWVDFSRYYILTTNQPDHIPLDVRPLTSNLQPRRHISVWICTTFPAFTTLNLTLRNPIVSLPPISPQAHAHVKQNGGLYLLQDHQGCVTSPRSKVIRHCMGTALKPPRPPRTLMAHTTAQCRRDPLLQALREREDAGLHGHPALEQGSRRTYIESPPWTD